MRSGTARRVALRVDPARGDICLVIPKRGSEKAAWKFADQNRAWIESRLATMEKPVPFTDGAVLPILGVPRTLVIIPHTSRTTDITLTDTTLEVRTSRADPTTNIRNYLYKLLLDTVWPLAREKADIVGRQPVSIQLRDTRARWGSCAPDGRIVFCWRLVFAPAHVIDYVVAHECAHLAHMNHSQRFWALCGSLSDDMDGARAWLLRNGDRLLQYGLPQ